MSMPHLVIFGASGDLTARYLVPALAELWTRGALADGLAVLGLARDAWDTDAFRAHLDQRLPASAFASADARRAFLQAFDFAPADITSGDEVQRALASARRPLVAYLAIPSHLFAPAVQALGQLPPATVHRIVVEKPFGTDLPSARALNATLHRQFPESAVFRIDHFLGHQTVQNILGLRFGNRLFEPIWNTHHIERMEFVWDETLTAAGRASYYDRAGALRDMLQNHLLQLMALAAMEPPHAFDERAFRNAKAELLSAVRTLDRSEVAARSVRGRYTAGTIAGVPVPAYVAERGVDPSRDTETFAQVTLAVDNWRWAGVPFVLRSGKGLGEDRRLIRVHFKPVPFMPFPEQPDVRPNLLQLELQPDRVSLRINLNGAGDRLLLEPAVLDRTLPEQELSPYARLLLDVLRGDCALAIRGDEVEESWRIMTPVLEAWAAGGVPLREYAAGSSGPGDATR
jgi:glucose-6-phosphate 1-dehydrogenase